MQCSTLKCTKYKIFLQNLLIFHLDKYLSKYEYLSKYVK